MEKERVDRKSYRPNIACCLQSVAIDIPKLFCSKRGISIANRQTSLKNSRTNNPARRQDHYEPIDPRGGYELTECLLSPKWEAILDTTVKELLAQV